MKSLRDPAAMTNEDVIKCASQRVDDIARWLAIDDLARRALKDSSLFGPLCQVLRNDKTIGIRYFPSGTFLAIGRILDSGNENAICLLLAEFDGWTAQEQEDVIAPWTGYRYVVQGSRDLTAKYGWTPKYLADPDAAGIGFLE